MTRNCILLIQEHNSPVDVNQLVHQLEELHPIAFRLAFGLTHEEAAEELGLEPQTMRSYIKKNPSKRVKKLSATIAKRWLDEGRQLVDVQHLILQ
jgi:predicted transcriptional regulator